MGVITLAQVKPCKSLFGTGFAVEVNDLFNKNVGKSKVNEYIVVDHLGKRQICQVISLAVSNTTQFPNLPQQLGASFLNYDEALATSKRIIDEPIKINVENYKLHKKFLILPRHEREFLSELIEKHNIDPFKEISPKDQRTINIYRDSHIKTSIGINGYVPVFAPIAQTDYVPFPDYEIKGYDVVGTKYNNDDGVSRQVILERILKKQPPYAPDESGREKIELVKYKFQNEDAVYVKVNGGIIGNIARSDLPFLLKNFAIHEIHGAAFVPNSDGSRGFAIHIKFKKIDIIPLSLQEELLQESAVKAKEMNNSRAYTTKRPYSRKKNN